MKYHDRVAAMIAMALITTLLTGCAGTNQGPGPTSLLLTHWEADDIGGQPVLSGEPPTLRFTDDQSQVNGYAGCNRFFGTAELNGDSCRRRTAIQPPAAIRPSLQRHPAQRHHRIIRRAGLGPSVRPW